MWLLNQETSSFHGQDPSLGIISYTLISFQVHICSAHSSNRDTHSATQKQGRPRNWHALDQYRLHGQKHGVVSTADLLLACNAICNAICNAMQLLAAVVASLHYKVPQICVSMLAMHADSIFRPSTLTRAIIGAVYCMHADHGDQPVRNA